MSRAVILPVAALLFVLGLAVYVWLGATARPEPTPSAAATPTSSTAGETGMPTIVPSAASAAPTAAPTPGVTAVLVGAGDIAGCGVPGDEATADLLEGIAGTVFTLGDNVYNRGTPREFRECYGPSWGRPSIKERTRPVLGNHEYGTAGAAGHFGYFGGAAGDPDEGWYAYDAGEWRVYVLNSNCKQVDGCETGSVQERWLRANLAANPRDCTVAMWHHPLFSSGVEHGNDPATRDLWRTLQEAGAELVLVGHEHDYERFAPQTAGGELDEANGIVEIVVGTGGRSHYGLGTRQPNSLVFDGETFGVLRLELSPGAYAFEFVPVAGEDFTDSGTGACH